MTTQTTELDRQRGHAFYPSDDVLAEIPGPYQTEHIPLDDKILHLHYFCGGADWYVVELNAETKEAFGWAELIPGCGEWGYFSLSELAELRIGPFVVERDLDWLPR